MRRAKKEGRWMGHAPVGYKNKTSENGKKYIAIHEPQASHMKWAFEQLTIGLLATEHVWMRARERGLCKCTDSDIKRSIVGSIYHEKWVFDGEAHRTPEVNEAALLKSLTTEVINKEEFGLTNPQMRRAGRTKDPKRKPEEIEKESQFIYLITQLIAEIIKSDIQNEEPEHRPTQHTDNQTKKNKNIDKNVKKLTFLNSYKTVN